MPRKVFQCAVCESVYPTEDKAAWCEQEHPPKGSMQIASVHYARSDRLFGIWKAEKMKIPQVVWIVFGDGIGQRAEYTLSHIGMRGL